MNVNFLFSHVLIVSLYYTTVHVRFLWRPYVTRVSRPTTSPIYKTSDIFSFVTACASPCSRSTSYRPEFNTKTGLRAESQAGLCSFRCRHQFAYPTLARLATKYFAIPTSSAASERVFVAAGNVATKKRNKSGDDTVDALVFFDGSHGLAWSSRISRGALGREDK